MNLKLLAPLVAVGMGLSVFAAPASAFETPISGKVVHTEQIVTNDGLIKELTFKNGKVVDSRLIGRVDHRFRDNRFRGNAYHRRSFYGKSRYHPRSRFVTKKYSKRYYGSRRIRRHH